MRRKGSLGNQLEEILKVKEKSEKAVRKLSNDYPQTACKLAKEVLSKLSRELDKMGKEGEDPISVADNIYTILVESNFTTLEKVKQDYDVWYDLYEKFNS